MTSSEIPPDDDNGTLGGSIGKNIHKGASSIEPTEETIGTSVKFSLDQDTTINDIHLDEIEGLDRNDFRADTLEFEAISRRPKRRTAGIKTLLFLLIIGVGGYFSWAHWGDVILTSSINEVPIVQAPEKPFKVRPDEPGGKIFPNRDKLVYDRLDRKSPRIKAENLLPRPEVPLLPPRSGVVETNELTLKSERLNIPPRTIGSQPSTKEVRAVKKPTLNFSSSELGRLGVKNSVTMPPETQSTSLSNTVPTNIRDQVIKSQGIESYQIQLAAVRTVVSAKKEWLRLRAKNSNLLSNLKLNIMRADLGNQGIFFRLRAGPIENQTSAKALCQALSRKKVGCLVIAPLK